MTAASEVRGGPPVASRRETIQPKGMKRPVHARLTPAATKHVKRGHPWVFDQSITHLSHTGEAGDVVVLHDASRKQIGLGLLDPRGPIRVRVLLTGRAQIGEAFFADRVRAAVAIRERLNTSGTNGYRVIHGENDGFGGLVVDRYANVLVVKVYSRAWFPHLDAIVDALTAHFSPAAVVFRRARSLDDVDLEDGTVIRGSLSSPRVRFSENGLLFEADPIAGQKTGFFLDQRDNREKVGARSQDKTVLNVFSYSGGFSVYAQRGGARAVTSLDLSQPALDDAAQHFAINGFPPHRCLQGDAFEVLKRLAKEGSRYDVVVIDPPAFAKRQSEVDGALRAYARLTRLGLDVLDVGGELVLASCSSRVDASAFRDNALSAAQAHGQPLTVVEETGHALDHPSTFPEASYLKCLYCQRS